MTVRQQARQQGWWYPYIFVALLAVVAVVNGIMAYFATSTFNGLVTDNAYEKGLGYNATLALARAQANMGWTVEVVVTPAADHHVTLDASFVDKAGQPIDGLTIAVIATRPTQAGLDQTLSLSPSGPGKYQAKATLPMGGEWDFDLLAQGGPSPYSLQKRLLVP